MVFTVILAGVAGGLFGCLIGMTIITIRDVIRLERELTDERRRARLHELAARGWRQAAERWRARAKFHERMHKLERQILGIEPGGAGGGGGVAAGGRRRGLMGVTVGYDPYAKVAYLCDGAGVAFGPLLFLGNGAEEDALDFLDWLKGPGADYADRTGIRHKDGDARTFMSHDLPLMRERWENERVAEGEHQDEAKAKGG